MNLHEELSSMYFMELITEKQYFEIHFTAFPESDCVTGKC